MLDMMCWQGYDFHIQTNTEDFKMICKGFSIEQKKEILDRAHGQYFSCSWIKKDLTERKAVCKKWQAKYLHGAVGENKNPVAHIPYFYTIAEDAVQGYRNVDLRTLKHARVSGVDYEFED